MAENQELPQSDQETSQPQTTVTEPRFEVGVSLQDQIINETVAKAQKILSSEDPSVVKVRREIEYRNNEIETWLQNNKITPAQYKMIATADQLEARTNVMNDNLTGLLNLWGLEARLTDLISAATRYRNQLNLLYIDLEGFKKVNDTLGHKEGDKILNITADFLRQIVRGSDAVARVGGDEFVVAVLESRYPKAQQNGEKQLTAQERILNELQNNFQSFVRDAYEMDGATTIPHIGARVGTTSYLPGESKAEFINRADLDMNSKRDPNKPSR